MMQSTLKRLLSASLLLHLCTAIVNFPEGFLISYADVEAQKSIQLPLEAPYFLYATVDKDARSLNTDNVVVISAGQSLSNLTEMFSTVDAKTGRLTGLAVPEGVLTIENNNPVDSSPFSWYIYGIKQSERNDAVPVYEASKLAYPGFLDSQMDHFDDAVTILHASAPHYFAIDKILVDPTASLTISTSGFPSAKKYEVFTVSREDQKAKTFDSTASFVYITAPIVTVTSDTKGIDFRFRVEPGLPLSQTFDPGARVRAFSPGYLAEDTFVPTFYGNQIAYKFDAPIGKTVSVDYHFIAAPETGDVINFAYHDGESHNATFDTYTQWATSAPVDNVSSVAMNNLQSTSPLTRFAIFINTSGSAIVSTKVTDPLPVGGSATRSPVEDHTKVSARDFRMASLCVVIVSSLMLRDF